MIQPAERCPCGSTNVQPDTQPSVWGCGDCGVRFIPAVRYPCHKCGGSFVTAAAALEHECRGDVDDETWGSVGLSLLDLRERASA